MPLKWLMKLSAIRSLRKRIHGPALPWESLDLGLNKLGWTKLHDAKVTISLKGTSIELRGTDDAHLERDRYEPVS